MTITLTTEIEKGLIEQAGKLGTSPEALAIETLRQAFAPIFPHEASTCRENLVDFLGDFVGCLSSDEYVPGGAQLSTDPGKRFAEGLLERRRQGNP